MTVNNDHYLAFLTYGKIGCFVYAITKLNLFQSEFERLVDDGKFLEHGEYDKQMYGTTITSVRNIIASGKVRAIRVRYIKKEK